MNLNRTSTLPLFPDEVGLPTKRLLVGLPLVVSVVTVILLEQTVVLYVLLGSVAAVILGWFLYRFADRSVTKALFIILLVTISLQHNYLGLPLDPTRVSRLLLFLYIIKSLHGGELRWEKTALNGAILLLFLVFFASTLVADEIGTSLVYLKCYLYMGIFYFVVIHILRERTFTVKAFKTYAVLAFLIGLYGIWQFSRFFGQAIANVASEVTLGLPRAGGLSSSVNWFGAYLGSAFPLVVGFFLGAKEKRDKAFWLVVVIVILGGLLFTVSRSALFSFGCTIIVLCIYSKVLRREYLKTAAQSLYILAPLGIFLTREIYFFYIGMRNLLQQSLTLYAHLSTELHLWLYKAAIKMFLHNPVLGVGIGNFYNNLREYMEPHPVLNKQCLEAFSRGVRLAAHSSWLDILSEVGIIGFIAYLLVLMVAFRYFHMANRKFLTSDPQLFYLSTGLMGGMISICFSGLFQSYTMTVLHWFFVACSYVMFSLARKGENK